MTTTATRTAPSPTPARVATAEAEGMDDAGGDWLAICDRHSTLVNVATQRLARATRTADFCEACRDGAPSAYALAELAGCAAPDTPTSPGARFLLDIAEAVEDRRDEGEDAAAYVADAQVPIYTSDVWAVFVDLAAYQEDTSELGDQGGDLTRSASLALYSIGSRLASALIEAQA